MGFDVVKAREQTSIRVPIRFRENWGEFKEYDVVHVFTIPLPSQREEYQRRLVKVKGKKIVNMGTYQANWDLWLQCIKGVEGYDNLPPKEEDWKQLFRDVPLLRVHIDVAIEKLLESLTGDEAEEEKKLERSSVE